MFDKVKDFKNYLTAEKGLSQNSIISYGRDLKKFVTFLTSRGITSPHTVTKGHIIDYLIVEKNRGISSNSISRNLIAIKLFFRFLVAEPKHYIKKDVTETIESPKLWRILPEVLTIEEVEKLLSLPDISENNGLRDRAILEFLYATGMRISELSTCKLSDFNPSAGLVLCRGKGSKERLIPIGKQAIYWTNRYLRESRPKLLRKKMSEFLFITRLGRKFSRQGLWKMIHRYVKMLRLPKKITPHTLRHSVATHLLSGGADIRIIQAILGHANISTTQFYTQVDKNRLKSIHHRYHPRG